MPHKAAIREDKGTIWVWIIYDCSCRANENKKSLNDSLGSEFNLYRNLIDVILKFLKNQVAFCGNLERLSLWLKFWEKIGNVWNFWFPDESDNSIETLNRLFFGLYRHLYMHWIAFRNFTYENLKMITTIVVKC